MLWYFDSIAFYMLFHLPRKWFPCFLTWNNLYHGPSFGANTSSVTLHSTCIFFPHNTMSSLSSTKPHSTLYPYHLGTRCAFHPNSPLGLNDLLPIVENASTDNHQLSALWKFPSPVDAWPKLLPFLGGRIHFMTYLQDFEDPFVPI